MPHTFTRQDCEQKIADYLDLESVDPAMALDELCDSLELAELIITLDSDYDIILDKDKAFALKTVGGLVLLVEEALNA